jgi:hypothetical protein
MTHYPWKGRCLVIKVSLLSVPVSRESRTVTRLQCRCVDCFGGESKADSGGNLHDGQSSRGMIYGSSSGRTCNTVKHSHPIIYDTIQGTRAPDLRCHGPWGVRLQCLRGGNWMFPIR